MTSAHVFYIPVMLLLGAVGGFVMGRRMLLAEQQEQAKRAERQAQRHNQQ